MKLKTFINSFARFGHQLEKDTILYFLDENDEPLFINHIHIKRDEIVFEIGKNSNYSAQNIIDEIEDEDPSMFLYARNNKKGTNYILQQRLGKDDDGGIYFRVTIEKESPFEDTEEFRKDFKDEYKDEGVFSGKITELAKKMGIKLVYIAYWLYYSLTSGHLKLGSIAIVTGALGYLLCPTDIISDFLPFVGFTDDASVLIAAYYATINSLSSDAIKKITNKAKKAVRNIFGDFAEDDINF